MTDDERPRVAVVVSFLDEGAHLGRLLASIEGQTEAPDQLLLIDDGSADDGPQQARAFVQRVAYARFLQRPRRPAATDRLAGAPELRAFQWGVSHLDDAWDVVVKMDGDLELSPSLLCDARDRFVADPGLGITGADLAIVDADGTRRIERNPHDHVRGPNKFYRRRCFEQISPVPTILGWDTIDDQRAQAAGWRTESFTPTSGPPLHLRPTGVHDGRLRAQRRWGRCAWAYGAHPVWVVGSALRRTSASPPVLAGASYLGGWAWAGLRHAPRAEPEILALRRRRDLRRLRNGAVTRIAGVRARASRMLGRPADTLGLTPPAAPGADRHPTR